MMAARLPPPCPTVRKPVVRSIGTPRWGIFRPGLGIGAVVVLFATVLFATVLWAQTTQQPPTKQVPGEWKVSLVKAGDRVKITPEKTGVIVDIFSESGIGRATLEPPDGQWPTGMVLRLHLRGLESFRLEAGPWGCEVSVMSYPPYKTRLRVHGPDPMPRLDPKSPFWMVVKMRGAEGKPASKIPLERGYFELALPPAFLAKAPQKLEMHWIDFYRD